MKIEIKIGDKYGRLTIIEEVARSFSPCGQGHRRFLCKCECGKEKVFLLHSLRNGNTKSCGCFHSEKQTIHGGYKSKGYSSWDHMIQSCTNPNTVGFPYYGGKGITLKKEWLKFENFLKDMGERPDGTILGRIDTSKNYEKENCKWMTRKENAYSWGYIKDRTQLKKTEDRRGDTLSIELRKQAKERDNHKCKIGNKECEGQLEVHHILRWQDFPELRYELNNLITLCHYHHPRKKEEESRLSPYFKELIKE